MMMYQIHTATALMNGSYTKTSIALMKNTYNQTVMALTKNTYNHATTAFRNVSYSQTVMALIKNTYIHTHMALIKNTAAHTSKIRTGAVSLSLSLIARTPPRQRHPKTISMNEMIAHTMVMIMWLLCVAPPGMRLGLFGFWDAEGGKPPLKQYVIDPRPGPFLSRPNPPAPPCEA